MELVYTATKPRRSNRRDFNFREETPLISLSTHNALALCTTVHLNDTGNSDRPVIDIVYHIYVCDIDKPWAIHRLASVGEQVVGLQWHSSGLQLLVATLLGTIYIYQMKDFLLNSWHDKPCMVNINGEEIISVSWLHPGGLKTFCADKKDSTLYSEKVINSMFKPSLSQYGGKPVHGLIAVTATGMAVVALPKTADSSLVGGEMQTEIVPLCEMQRTRVHVADIAFDSNGGILVVTSDGSLSSPIQCHRIELKRSLTDISMSSCSIICSPVASFFMRCHTDVSKRESSSTRVTHVCYVDRNSDGHTLLIGAGDQTGSHIELWQLTKQLFMLHRFFQPSDVTTSPLSVQLQRWVHHSTISHASMPTSVAVPRFPVLFGNNGSAASVMSPPQQDTMSSSSTVLFQYIAIAYRDGSVKLVDKQTFQPMTTTNLDTGITDFTECNKRRRSIAYMTCMQQTLAGCVLVGIDQYSCVYVMKTMNTRDPVTQVPLTYLVGMFEYLLTSGIDWWDVLTVVKPGMIEAVQQRLLDDFAKQPRPIQELYFCRLMAVRASLARCTSNGRPRAADSHCQLMLHAVSNHFKSVLRPKMLAANEVSPAERLSTSCARCQDTDLDSVICSLGTEKKFVVDAPTQQSMQPLIQWVADLALYLVTTLPVVHHSAVPYAGVSMLRNVRVLATIRELLVMVRMWGMVNTSCLPTFTVTTSGVDMLALLFALITRMWTASVEMIGQDFDGTLIDDCCALTGQVLQNPIDDGLFGNTECAMLTFTPAQPHPVKYVFGEPPATTSRFPPPSNNSTSLFPPGMHVSSDRRDVVRLMLLGNQPPELVRVCSRCCSASFASSQQRVLAKAPAMRVWELRFERSCVCGGQWMLETAMSAR